MKAVIIYSRGKAWIYGKPHWEQKLRPHRQYLVEVLTDFPKEFSFLKRVQGDSPTIGGS
jgi:hypothetical protein